MFISEEFFELYIKLLLENIKVIILLMTTLLFSQEWIKSVTLSLD